MPASAAILNTLAVVYAETGKSSEAREVLLKGTDLRASDSLDPADWYVIGRIAENYGIVEVAADAYRRVGKDKESQGGASELARRRLATLKVSP